MLLNKLDVAITDLKCYNFNHYFREFPGKDETDIKNVIEFIVSSAIDTDSIQSVFKYIHYDFHLHRSFDLYSNTVSYHSEIFQNRNM